MECLKPPRPGRADTCRLRLWHNPARKAACFDDPNLVSCSGLVPVMALAEGCGLSAPVRGDVTIAAPDGVRGSEGAPPFLRRACPTGPVRPRVLPRDDVLGVQDPSPPAGPAQRRCPGRPSPSRSAGQPACSPRWQGSTVKRVERAAEADAAAAVAAPRPHPRPAVVPYFRVTTQTS
jgi:hypothetical protein